MVRHLLWCTLTMSAAAADFDDKDLDQRIRALRQVDAAVRLPAEAAGPVRYRLERHAFPFGTAVGSQLMEGAWAKPEFTQEDRDQYGRIAATHFTAAVAENEHKWYGMEKADGTQDAARAEMVYRWCQQRDLYLRGHCVFWGVPKWQPDWMKELPAGQVEARMKRRMQFITETFRGRITEWDLMNELTDSDLFAAKVPGLGPVDYFRWAVEADPKVTWCVNEYGPLQAGKIAPTVKLMQTLASAGVKVGALGDQAHFFGPLPESKEVWRRLDALAACGVPLIITEYDQSWNGMTEEQQGEALRRFVSICYAHPAVQGIYLWGFWDGKHWRKNCGLWRRDWSIKPNGQAWVDLLGRTWHSAGEVAGEAGVLRFRGFPGRYRLDWQGGGATVQITSNAEVEAH